jgi:cyclophilin family peptidyl-prolyl cis-trans isomerase
MADSDHTVVATAAPLLGHHRGERALTALCRAYELASGEGASDVRLAVLDGLARALTPDSLATAQPEPTDISGTLRQRLTRALEQAFDSRDIRLRLKGREVALATRLLPDELIPGEASLRATLPAFVRSRLQPPVTGPFAAPRVRCMTGRGEFVIALDGKSAPNTVASFLALIRKGFYDGLTFHRVVPDFVVQGGDPRGDGWGGPGYTIRSEWSRLPYERGTVGIAHAGKDTGGSQFFVALSPQPHLNGRYTVFGRVIKGMDAVDSIQPQDTFRLVIEQE